MLLVVPLKVTDLTQDEIAGVADMEIFPQLAEGVEPFARRLPAVITFDDRHSSRFVR